MRKNPIANPYVVLRKEFDDWAVLFNPETAEAVGVNEVGVAVWEMLDGEHDMEAIVRKVCHDFHDVSMTVDHELRAFVTDLEERGFVGVEAVSDAT
jgi:SynChlorMet cassette protein ScmD